MPDEGRGALGGYRVAFADSRAALEAAYAAGLPRDAAIRTCAPALALAGIPTVEPVERRFPRSRRAALHETTLGFVKATYEATAGRKETAPFALTAARVAFDLQRIVYRAACLDEADFTEPRAILAVETGDKRLDTCVNLPWSVLLASNSAARRFTFPVEPPQVGRSLGGVPPGLLSRLRISGLDKVFYRFFLWLWKWLPSRLARGEALITSENELVKEAAFHLALRGFALRRMRAPVRAHANLPPDQDAGLREAVEPVVRSHLTDWVVPQAVDTIVSLFFEEVRAEVARQVESGLHWGKVLDRLVEPDRTVVMAGVPKGGPALALAELCRARRIPFVAFQHGVAREISAPITHHQVLWENNVADWFFTFSRKSAEISDTSLFARGQPVPVGLPKDYFRVGGVIGRRTAGPPILFVSTTVYRSGVQSWAGWITDIGMAQREIDLVERVLARLPHRVMFKPYPTIRYADPDPVIEVARRMPNISVYQQEHDLRYLLRGYRVIVTCRATSTVAWCLMSGKPLVFIDMPDHMSLTPEAREAFEAGTFLFDVGSAAFAEELRAFLSRPIEAIEADWAHKAEGRARLIEEFITVPRPGAGRRAARAICRILASGDEAALNLAETKV